MKYAPIESQRLHDTVVQLYMGSWESSTQAALTLVHQDEAVAFVQELTRSTGWRERVVAARITYAFKLHELVKPLVETFSANPETYTGTAFARLAATFESTEKELLLGELRQACPDNSFGRHFLETIEKSSASDTAA